MAVTALSVLRTRRLGGQLLTLVIFSPPGLLALVAPASESTRIEVADVVAANRADAIRRRLV
jgi:hypothetical protein